MRERERVRERERERERERREGKLYQVLSEQESSSGNLFLLGQNIQKPPSQDQFEFRYLNSERERERERGVQKCQVRIQAKWRMRSMRRRR